MNENLTEKEKSTMANTALDGKPYAGNTHVRIDEGDGAPAKPRRSSLAYNLTRKFEKAEFFCAY